ncbi:helix-turn-helix domain-containing protein [Plebeiibacterium sediminum]|uniref:AraC family transcriptional regulator n=1 Tax=Plebeiibacterium sediminum TaxID=2992112 RepID=A0AAE3SFB1_9BACT|nr:AraC family transcriptional regulator [Plebeiobacterium sediminum]MCW3787096.1 AraC family transcriptional regulator [Plebeiobacterium sediminum]
MKLEYLEHKPGGVLNQYVECFWEYKNTGCEKKHTIIPDGHFEVIAEYESETHSKLYLTGIWTEPKNVIVPENGKVFGIRFKLLAAEFLFPYQIRKLLNKSLHIQQPRCNRETYTKNNFEFFISNATACLKEDIHKIHSNNIDIRKLRLFELIYNKKNYSVEELSQKVGWSSRQINRYFNNQFGLSLKEYLKILRCKNSYQEISNGILSPQKDFYDQSHFIKEIKKYTGTTPKSLYQNKNDRFLQLSTANYA